MVLSSGKHNELLQVFLIVAGVIVGVGAAGLVGLLTWRWRRTQADALPAEVPRELPAEVHSHLHGVSAEEIAAILRRQDQP